MPLTATLGVITAAVVVSMTAQAASPRVEITPAAGFAITWDGNNGGFKNPESGARAPDNAALAANGAVPFASSSFLPGGIHDSLNVNDGFYGNSSSWIANFSTPDTNPFVGLNFGKMVAIKSIAWSRDNGDDTERTPPGPFSDRAEGIYTLQITRVSAPNADTAESNDPATGWATIGTVAFKPGGDGLLFTAHLRHRFDVSAEGNPISATGLRIKVSSNGICIDEIEVNPPADPEPPISTYLSIDSASGYTINWNGNDGLFSSDASPARVPENRASPTKGTLPFGSSEFGGGVHLISHINDGLYGNAHSWIAKFTAPPDPNPFIGLNFGEVIELRNIAWSRDNGDVAGDCCGGTLKDRSLGVYTLQVTQAPKPGKDTPENPDPKVGWVTIGMVQYKAEGPSVRPHLRHMYGVSQGNNPILASGLRIKVSDVNIAIDEIEVNVNPALQAQSEGLIVISNETGYSIGWDGNDGELFSPNVGAAAPANAALAANGTTAFGSGQLFADGSIHDIDNVIDGLYGNSKSWIPGTQLVDPEVDPAQDAFIGVRFGKTVPISSIAWGRDNGNNPGDCCGGQLRDRWQGKYTLQVTTVASPGAATPETGNATTGWATIGLIEYAGEAAPDFNPWLRHRFSVSQSGAPIPATALRIKVSNSGTCIDEIEVNPAALSRAAVVIQRAAGYSIEWNGNNGKFSTTNSPAPAPRNAALASAGTVAFGSSEFGANIHLISHINDGLYGNSKSWIAKFTAPPDPNPFIGLNFGKSIPLRNVAWGRDNGNLAGDCCGGELTDRALGIYTLQITRVTNPGTATAETGDPATGWATIGSIEYTGEKDARFTPHRRHAYTVAEGNSPIAATGLRIKVSDPGMAIDEIEVNVSLADEGDALELKAEAGYEISWDGNNGDFFNEQEGAAAPDNLALATKGVTAFGSSEFDGGGFHLIANINDGLYGNSKSWISDFRVPDPVPFIGLNFGKLISFGGIAWGRDNGNNPGDCCGGQLRDRWGGTYTLQFTRVANPGAETPETSDPATGWVTIGSVIYKTPAPPDFSPWLRHQYQVRRNGQAIEATGIRFKTSDIQICIDEIEVSPPTATAPKFDGITVAGGEITITWTGTATLEASDSVTGTWAVVPNATSPLKVPSGGVGQKFYRLRQ